MRSHLPKTLGEWGGTMAETRTLCDVFFQLIEVYDRPDLLRSKVGGAWRSISSEQFGRSVTNLSCGLMSLGVKPGDKVVLVAFGGGLTWGAILMEWA